MSLKEHLTGKKILVTGAGRGIGRALCVRLHEYGAKVFALSQTQEHLISLEKECPGIDIICVDVGNWSATRTEVSKLELLDGLINNAGILRMEDFMQMTSENLDKILNVNLKSVVNISQIVAQKMIEAGKGGSIVNVSSAAGKRPSPHCVGYSTSKAALDMMTKNMALALGPHKIRVNSISPGPVETDMERHWRNHLLRESQINQYSGISPLGESIIPMDDIVNTTLFLLSGMVTMMTGELVGVDCGFLLT